ncbi:MAG: WYL domain-containing protein [Clostridiales bacterium]
MAGKQSQKQKLLYLMKLFWEETDEDHPLTMEEIIRRLGAQGIDCERRSVYDDIRLLQDFGLDILGEKRKNYVYYLGSRDFELAELKLLVDTVSAARFITGKKSQQLIKKLSALTSRYLAGQLKRQVYVSGRVKAFNEGIYYNVDAIHRGINENRQVSFKYFDYDMGKNQVLRRQGHRYQVSPYLLCWDNENYYMVAYHRRYERLAHFRVDKMTEIQLEEERRQPLGENIDPAAYCQSVFGMFSGEESRVKVRFAAELIGVVIDRFGKEVSITREDENWFVASIKVTVSPVFFSWLIQFGARAQILEPAEVRQQMKSLLNEALEKY